MTRLILVIETFIVDNFLTKGVQIKIYRLELYQSNLLLVWGLV